MTNKELVNKYYEMWNSQDFEKADSLLDSDVRFRGSLDITANGLDGFKDYAKMIATAFPRLYHAVEITVFENNTAAVYVTYTGKHEGKLLDYEPTGNRISYSGAAFFSFKNEKILSINVLGDLNALYKQLNSNSNTQ
jgi:steroid delta-isomerase-like uncharacterized protein